MLKAAFARKSIFPQDISYGPRLLGYGNASQTTLLRDCAGEHKPTPIGVHTLLLESGSQRMAILSLDVLGMDVDLVNELRRKARESFNVSNMLVAATHTHSSLPAVSTCAGGPVDIHFRNTILRSVNETLEQAELGLEEVVDIESAQNTTSDLNENRRKYEDRPVDRRVSILRVKTVSGKRILAVRYTCHPVCFGRDNLYASSDFVGYLETMLRQEGDLLFLNGCAGYVKPSNLKHQAEIDAGRIATGLVRAITSAKVKTTQNPSINSSETPVNLTFQPVEPKKPNWIKLATSGPAEINALRIGDVILVGLPGEPFTETGAKIEAACGLNVWVIGYTDGYFGYLIDQTAEDRANTGQADYEAGSAPQSIGYKIHASDASCFESAAIDAANKIL